MEIKLGKRLKELREESGLTQKELANLLEINPVTYLHMKNRRENRPLHYWQSFRDFLMSLPTTCWD